jgi:hypothetical protein
MQPDLFTRTMLMAIAFFLGVIALRPLVQTESAQAGAGEFDHVRYLGRFGIGQQSGNLFLDARTGDIWGYGYGATSGSAPEVLYIGRLTRLGEPLAGRQP